MTTISMQNFKNSIAIFGGTFDPVHKGHITIVKFLVQNCCFQKVIILPAGNPPHKKQPVLSKYTRLKMLKQALRRFQKNVRISHFELKSKHKSYAIWSISYFKKRFRKMPLFFILGADAFCTINQWYQFPKVLFACNYLILSRKGVRAMTVQKTLGQFVHRKLLIKENRFLYKTREGFQVRICNVSLPNVSSTLVRQRYNKI